MIKLNYVCCMLLLLFVACNSNSTEQKEDITTTVTENNIQPSAPQQAAPVASNNTGYNEYTVDDDAAERIKNFLINSFLQRDIPLMAESDKQFQLYRIDLNEDGIDEYFVRFQSSYFCGSGGCTVLLLNNNLTVINRFTVMQTPIYVSKVTKNGWRSLMVKSEGAFREMNFENGKYPSNPSVLPSSKLPPNEHDEILFEDDFPSKTYVYSEKPTQMMQKSPAPKRLTVFQRTYNAGTFAFKINATNGETTPIHVSTTGLPRAFEKTFEIEGALRDAHLLDLNNDGFKELYLITQPTGDSGNLDIMGIASFRDKSAGEIYVKDTKEIREVNSDKVFVENGELRRTFVTNGKRVSFKYVLKKGETSFVLEAEKV